MNINKLKLISFGKFKDKTIELNEGINIIYGLNEAGKSTIHQFIESMIFGFIKEGYKTKRYKDSYFKYEPLEEVVYSGEFEFEQEDNSYLVRRIFNKGNEKIDILNLNNGHKLEKLELNELIGISNKHFINGNYISQGNETIAKSYYTKIEEEMLLVNDKRFENKIFKNMKENFQQKKDAIGNENRAKTSPYGQLKAKITELIEEEKALRKIEENYRDLLVRLKVIDESIFKFNQEKNEMQLKIEKQKLKKQYEDFYLYKELINDLEKIEFRLKELESIGEANERTLNELNFLANDRERLIQKNKDIESYYKSRIEDLEEVKVSTSKKLKIVESSLILISSVVFMLTKNSLKLGAAIVLLCLTLLLFVQIISDKKRKDGIIKKLINMKEEEKLEKEENNRIRADIIKKEKTILENAYVTTTKEYESLIDLNNERTSLKNAWQTQKFLISERYPNMAYFQYDEAVAKELDKLAWFDISEEANKINRAEEIQKLEQEKRYIGGILKGSREGKRNLIEVEEEKEFYIKELAALEKQLKAYQAIIEVSEDILREGIADENKGIDSEIQSYFQKITKSCYTEIDIQTDGNIKVFDSDRNLWYDFEKLSVGTQKQFYFAIRMAVRTFVLAGKDMPMILDEAFVEYDDNRLCQVLEWMSEEAFGQSIIFTCTQRERNILDTKKIPYNYIAI